MIDKKPRTLLINFPSNCIDKLNFRKKIEVEFGYIHPFGKFHFFPSPPYEYDIVIANLDEKAAGYVEVNFPKKQKKPQDKTDLKEHIQKGFLLVFLGNFNEDGLNCCGLDWFQTQVADVRDKDFYMSNTNSSIFNFIFKKHDILLPIQKYISYIPIGRGGIDRLYSTRAKHLQFNKKDIPISIYTEKVLDYSKRKDGEEYPNYVPNSLILPQFKNNIEVINDILKEIIPLRPDIFPLESSKKWLEEVPFIPSEIIEIENKIQKKKKELEIFVLEEEKKKEIIKEKYKYFTEILVARDKELFESVKKVLEYLEFNIIDIDEKFKKTIKKEDYWVIDGDYFALCEVTGTKSKNPKASEYNGILGRINTALQRKEDRIPQKYQKEMVKGLLIINHDRNTHPLNRPKIYPGKLEEYIDAAKDDGISILSTVELFKISKDVRDNKLEKKEARSIIEQGGRIEYKKTNKSKVD